MNKLEVLHFPDKRLRKIAKSVEKVDQEIKELTFWNQCRGESGRKSLSVCGINISLPQYHARPRES